MTGLTSIQTILLHAFKSYIITVLLNLLWHFIEGYGKRFNSRSTANEVAEKIGKNLKNKNILITGCNSGIGKETAQILLKYGATIFMVCRNVSKAEKSRNDILHTLHKDKQDLEKRIKIFQCDLSSLESIYSFSKTFLSSNLDVHILINNAGIMALPNYTESKDHFELQFATNFLGHWYLTKLLLNKLISRNNKINKSATVVKVINVSSIGHLFRLSLHKTIDYCLKNKCAPPKNLYNRWMSYGFTKALNILHSNEINRIYGNKKDNIYSISLHPGVVGTTRLSQNMSWWEYCSWIFYTMIPGLTKNTQQGAATTVYAACINDKQFKENGGGYFKDCNVKPIFLGVSSLCNGSDIQLQSKLWKLGEELVKSKGFKLEVI